MTVGKHMTDLFSALEELSDVDYKVRKETKPSKSVRDAALVAVDEAARAWIDWRASGEPLWPAYGVDK